MKLLLICVALLVLLTHCQRGNNQQSSRMIVSQGRLHKLKLPGNCGQQLTILLENGERIVPYNLKELEPLPQDNTEIQVIYTELLTAPAAKPCLVGTPVKVSYLGRVR